ncbi:MAG: hypothetical protein ACI9W2_003131 [Gammaproteobacteria bacterium]|jgi:hypothetical protein
MPNSVEPPIDPYAPPEAALDVAVPGNLTLFPVGQRKFVIMSVATLGLYEYFWFYRNFQCMKTAGRDIWPVPRSFFYGLMALSLYDYVHEKEPIPRRGWLAFAVFVLSILWRLPQPWWLISFFGFLPLLPLRAAIERALTRIDGNANLNLQLTGGNWVWIVVGGLFWVLALAGTFLSKEYLV